MWSVRQRILRLATGQLHDGAVDMLVLEPDRLRGLGTVGHEQDDRPPPPSLPPRPARPPPSTRTGGSSPTGPAPAPHQAEPDIVVRPGAGGVLGKEPLGSSARMIGARYSGRDASGRARAFNAARASPFVAFVSVAWSLPAYVSGHANRGRSYQRCQSASRTSLDRVPHLGCS